MVAQAPGGVGVGVDAAVELHTEAVARSRDFPRVAVAEPAVRHLDLSSVDDPLMEDAVVVAKAVSVAGIAESRHRIEKAGGQSAETPVAEARIPLGLAEILETVTQVGQRLSARVAEAHGDQAVA